jgi:hypothetical protein
MLTLVLWRRADDLLAWSLICLGTAYAASLFAHGASVDDRAPLVAAALLLCAELAMWSLDAQYRIAAERRVVAARIVALALLVGGGLAAAGLVVALASTPAGGGLAWSTVGTLAAVLVVALVVGLVRRPG